MQPLRYGLASKKLLYTLNHPNYINAISFSHDGNILASVSEHAIKLWSMKSGKCIKTIKVSSAILSICFSPDTTKLTVGRRDGSITTYFLHDTKKDFTLSTLLLVEYLMFNKKRGTMLQLPSEELYFEAYLSLPKKFQKMFAAAINHHALKAYQSRLNAHEILQSLKRIVI